MFQMVYLGDKANSFSVNNILGRSKHTIFPIDQGIFCAP